MLTWCLILLLQMSWQRRLPRVTSQTHRVFIERMKLTRRHLLIYRLLFWSQESKDTVQCVWHSTSAQVSLENRPVDLANHAPNSSSFWSLTVGSHHRQVKSTSICNLIHGWWQKWWSSWFPGGVLLLADIVVWLNRFMFGVNTPGIFAWVDARWKLCVNTT